MTGWLVRKPPSPVEAVLLYERRHHDEPRTPHHATDQKQHHTRHLHPNSYGCIGHIVFLGSKARAISSPLE